MSFTGEEFNAESGRVRLGVFFTCTDGIFRSGNREGRHNTDRAKKNQPFSGAAHKARVEAVEDVQRRWGFAPFGRSNMVFVLERPVVGPLTAEAVFAGNKFNAAPLVQQIAKRHGNPPSADILHQPRCRGTFPDAQQMEFGDIDMLRYIVKTERFKQMVFNKIRGPVNGFQQVMIHVTSCFSNYCPVLGNG
ncbi:hypothetical protein D3C81_1560620 [compost metagenome]